MPYVADVNKAKTLEGQLIGNGQCVTFVHAIVTTPPSSSWHQAPGVRIDVASPDFDKPGPGAVKSG